MTPHPVKDAARRERNRVRVARDRLLQAAKKQKVDLERGPLDELASRLWPNRSEWTEKIVGRALIDDEDIVGGVVMKTESEDGATPDYGQREVEKAVEEEARRPSDDVLEEIVAFCHELLRDDHTLEWKVAWKKVRDRWPGFTDEKYFIRSPWRRAKVAERKERTGSGLTRETRERRERDQQADGTDGTEGLDDERAPEEPEAADPPEPAPSPEPPPREPERPADAALVVQGEDASLEVRPGPNGRFRVRIDALFPRMDAHFLIARTLEAIQDRVLGEGS